MAAKKPKGPGGRPSLYKEEYPEQARKLCLLGATDKELADFFGVDESTINRWKSSKPEFCKSLKEGKMQADAEVGQRLYERALGFSHPEEKVFQYEGAPVRVDTVKQYPPDTTAAIFWLKNRQPSRWRDKQDVEHSGADGGPIKVEELSTMEAAKRVLFLLAKAEHEAKGD